MDNPKKVCKVFQIRTLRNITIKVHGYELLRIFFQSLDSYIKTGLSYKEIVQAFIPDSHITIN